MVVTATYRAEVERRILETMARALESNQLKEEDTAKIAQFILDYLDECDTHPEVITFLDKLAQQWPVFAELGNSEMARVIESKKSDVTKNMEQLIHQGNIQGALETAKILKAQ